MNTKYKNLIVIYCALILCFLLNDKKVCANTVEGHTNTAPNITNNYYYGNYPYPENYNPYPNYNPGFNPYNNPNETYGNSANGIFVIPNNSYYYISGYDRNAYAFSSGQPMVSRVPILSGNYSYPTMVANRLIYNAYLSISSWCNNNILTQNGIQDYFLNFATIQSETPTQIIMSVNCALKKKGVIDGYVEFKLTINIQGNRYIWRKLNSSGKHRLYDDYEEYEFDSDSGKIIIIR